MDPSELRYPRTYNRYSTSESCFHPANSSPQQHNRGATFHTSNARIGSFYERQPVAGLHQQQPVQQSAAYPHQQQIDRLPYAQAHAQHTEVEARLRQARAKLDEAQEREHKARLEAID